MKEEVLGNKINKMVEDNIKLIYKPTANYYYSSQAVRKKYEFDELLSISTLALYKAAEKFDKSKGYEFSTYAITIIKYALLQFTTKDKWYFKRTVKEGKETFDFIDIMSTSTVISNNSNKKITIEDSLKDKEDHFKEIENKELVEYLLSTCIERERLILEEYFFDKKSQKQIAKDFQTSQPFISKVIRRNLERFKGILKEEGNYEG